MVREGTTVVVGAWSAMGRGNGMRNIFHYARASLGLAALAVAGCGGAGPQPSPTPGADGRADQSQAAQVLEVKSADYLYEPKELTVQPGPIRVVHTNQGPRRHTFNVRTRDDQANLVTSEQIARGDSVTIDFTILEEGTYRVYCNVSDHAELGHVGNLIVRRS